ncbi:olfactory receptor 2M3-like [Petromyzon marinus]|uniref:olfactory receptor 2M3-like n=1 Tax=Petromyzon marinus TaxID=7757 RepID=UPI003F7063C5|nr:odorant receptor [Petromyzon marinus]
MATNASSDLSLFTPDLILMVTPFREPPSIKFAVFFFTLAMFTAAIVGNCLLSLVILRDHQLHKAMYVLMAALSLTDIMSVLSILPRFMQNVASFNYISLRECMAQMFFLHLAIRMQSFTLTIMSVDRYLAIGYPLSYHSLMSSRKAIGTFVVATAAAVATCLGNVGFVVPLNLCKPPVIVAPYCDYLVVLFLSCGDLSGPRAYIQAALAITMVLPACAIVLTYALILYECRKPGLRSGQRKALKTCGTHFLVVSVFFAAIFFSFASGFSFLESLPRPLRYALQTAQYVFPPALNPVIYGLRTAEIRRSFSRRFRGKVVDGKAERLGGVVH